MTSILVACQSAEVKDTPVVVTPKFIANDLRKNPQEAVTTAIPDLVISGSELNPSQQQLQQAKDMEQLGNFNLSHDLLNSIDQNQLPASALVDYLASLASINEKLGNSASALVWLQRAESHTIAPDLASRKQRLELATRVYQANGLFLEAAIAATDISTISAFSNQSDIELQKQNDFILAVLRRTPNQNLIETKRSLTDANKIGWIDLALTFSKQTQAVQAKQNIITWLDQYPLHTASINPPTQIAKIINADLTPFSNIAVVLPISGPFKEVGSAIFDGFMANYYLYQNECLNSCEPLHTVTLFDSQKIQDWQQQYEQFQELEIDLVIGPLDKQHVDEIANLQHLPITTLALNYATEDPIVKAVKVTGTMPTTNLYQFGLSVEQEARQLAAETLTKANRRILIVNLEQPWAQRSRNAFQQQWQSLNGLVGGQVSFTGEGDHAQAIKQAFHINQSNKRWNELQNLLGTKLQFQARRRQDIDSIVLFALPADARQIVPILAFHDAKSVPVVASHHVYQGNIKSERDLDLEDLSFTDIKWMLTSSAMKTQFEKTFPKRAVYGRLYALGADAYSLHSFIKTLEILPSAQLSGMTGDLIHDAGKIWGRMAWAQFQQGQPITRISQDELQ